MKPVNLVITFVMMLSILSAGRSLPSPCYVLELESIGFPTAEKQESAWPIRDLIHHENKLYLAYGDAVVNTGPTDVMYYDLDKKKFFTEYTVDDEAIYKYRLVNGMLMIPGIDATEDWTYGNIYMLTDTGWIKYRSVPKGIHVNDLAWYGSRLFASTGSIANIGEQIEYAVGSIFASADMGKTWSLSYATASDEKTVYRVQDLIVYKDRLYAFPYAFSELNRIQIPAKYHKGLSKPYNENDEYLILNHDIFGRGDVLIYDDETWQYGDILPVEGFCYAYKPFVFKQELCMPVLSGEYIDYLNKEQQHVEQAKTNIFSYDGDRTKKIKFDYDRLVDVLIKKDTLYLLIEKNELYYIAATENLKKWWYYLIPARIGESNAIEYIDGVFYIGVAKGNIFKMSGRNTIRHIESADKIVPRKFYGAAQLPRDGKWYWTAIRKITAWGHLARITGEITYGNTIKIETENISEFSIFPPEYHLDLDCEVRLHIDKQAVYNDFVKDASELLCTRQDDDTVLWTVEKGDLSFAEYRPENLILGKTEIPLKREDADLLTGYWKADVIRHAAGTDIAFINYSGIRGDITTGDIHLEDIHDGHYQNDLCTFEASGEEIAVMLEYNLNQAADLRCCISGFSAKYITDISEIKLVETSLRFSKKYTVALEDYVARRAEYFLGRDIECTPIEKNTYLAMIEWFAEFKTIQDIAPRIIELDGE
jgi:hypothetical protein